MDSANGERSETQACEHSRSKCDKKCWSWAEGFHGADILDDSYIRPKYQYGLTYCNTKCESDLDECIASADDDENKQECEGNRIVCKKECSEWAEGRKDEYNFYGMKQYRYMWCSDCDSEYHYCINSEFDEEIKAPKCEEEKDLCFGQCREVPK
jgi:hypothetical protein